MLGSYVRKLWTTAPRDLYHKGLQKARAKGTVAETGLHPPCIFVLSTGRVGTQTLAALLALAANTVAEHEPSPKLFGLSKLAYQHGNDASAQEVLTEAFCVARSDRLHHIVSHGMRYVETSPQGTFLAPVIARSIPGVQFIHLVRDPRQVVRSGMRRKWYGGNVADPTRIEPLAHTDHAARWSTYCQFKKNLWLWNETNRWILQLCEQLPAAQTLRIKSEDLFSGHRESLEKLYDFVGTPTPSDGQIKRILDKQLNRQKRGQFIEIDNWSPEMRRDLFAFTRDVATQLDYPL